MFLFCFLSGLVEGVYAPKFLKKYGLGSGPDWFRGDGFVNLPAQGNPFNAPGEKAELDFDRTYKAGIWYKMPPVHADHVYWMGITGSKEDDRFALFEKMMKLYRTLPDG